MEKAAVVVQITRLEILPHAQSIIILIFITTSTGSSPASSVIIVIITSSAPAAVLLLPLACACFSRAPLSFPIYLFY